MVFSRSHIAMLHDAIIAALSLTVVLYLRWGSSFLKFSAEFLPSATLAFTLIACLSFSFFSLYQGLWRYASLRDLVTLTKAVSVAILIFYLGWFALNRLEGVPRSVPAIHWMVLLALLGGPRFSYRLLKDRTLMMPVQVAGIPVLLAGATDAAELFIRETQRNPRSIYRVAGILEKNQARIGRQMHGVTIYGGTLADVVENMARRDERPQRLVLTDETMAGEDVQALLSAADALGLSLARLPRMSEFKTGVSDKLVVRPVAIEDVLGRAQMPHDKEAMRILIEGKRVLVTGAGGSIGSELTRQIASFLPAQLIILENSEFNLYQIASEISDRFPTVPHNALLGDVRDSARIHAVFESYAPELVFHAAAIKHVPIAEENVEETILTNVIGTQMVADACVKYHVHTMVLISTDKAVNPANVMGATKRLAECYAQAVGKGSTTRFITVRFGNVLGSTGSVIPLFQKQLEAGGPLTVTHKDMVRYFMTIREAVGLVIQAAALSDRVREKAPIFVLDMGSPVKIEELALQMIRLAGLKPHSDIQIAYTGLRPGEKLFEELFHAKERLEKTPHQSIMIAHPREVALDTLAPLLQELGAAARARDAASALALLKQAVPEFEYQNRDIG